MKRKRFLACLMACAMVFALPACGEQKDESKGDQAGAFIEGTSIDFEDGLSGFAMVSNAKRRADNSVLSVKDYNGSKALFVENQGGAEMYVGIDVDALLGDRVVDVRYIQMDIGTEYADGSFSSASGYLSVFTGAELKETKVGNWSVYLQTANPKTVIFELGEGVAFTAGNDNYIMLVKDTDNGTVQSSLYIDNIVFADANKNVIAADSSVVMEPVDGFLKAEEVEEEVPAGKTVMLDETYAGDWSATAAISAEDLQDFVSTGVTITFNFELESGYDYYLLNVMDAGWNSFNGRYSNLTAKDAADEGEAYHLQSDGFIVFDDFSNTKLTVDLPADAVADAVAAGGIMGQTYGVTLVSANLEVPGAGGITKTVTLDEVYAGDWSATAAISAEDLQDFASTGVTITLNIELESGYDYYLLNVMDVNWNSLNGRYSDLVAKDAAGEGEQYHLQSDGFIVIDDFGCTKLTFAISAEVVADAINNGGIMGQTYGVTVVSATLVGPAAGGITKNVTLDDVYAGDWGATTAIPAEELQDFSSNGVTITFNIELESGYDYYLLNVMDAGWNSFNGRYSDLTAKDAAGEGEQYHLQSDGFIVIDDFSATKLTVTLPADAVADAINNGGIMGQTYGVTVVSATLVGSAAGGGASKTVAMDDVYAGDWGATVAIPAEELQDYASTGVTVTFKFELESGYDYYLINPMDAGWNSFNGLYTDLTAKDAAGEGEAYHLQSDGFIVIDDWDNDELTFTIPAEVVQTAIENGGIMGQTYGVTVFEAKLK